MIDTAFRLTAFALYQLTVAFGILMLPIALLARRVGVQLPIRNLLAATESAYERAASR